MEMKVCETCNKMFIKPKYGSQKTWANRKFCSLKCRRHTEKTKQKISILQLGKPKTPNHIKNMAASKIGIPRTAETVLKISNSHMGIHPSEKTKRKMSISRMGKYGELGNNWQGGLTSLNILIRDCSKYSEWRSMVFGRDNFTCQECGIRGTYFEAHHIKRFVDIIKEYNINSFEEALLCDKLWDISNGITLCKTCHNKITFKKEK